MKVKFLKSVTTKTRPEDQQSFKAGEVVELPEPSAQHWINRNAAVEVAAKAGAASKAAESGK